MSCKSQSAATKAEAARSLVPKLRFPGFSTPWAYDPLSEVLTEHKLKNTAGRDVFSVSMEHGIVNQIELLGRSFAAADTSHYTIGRRYDVVYTKSPLKAFPFGIVKQCKFDGEVALSPLYGVFTPSNPHLGLMIEAYFESPNRSKDFLSPLCQKGAKNTLQITNTTFLFGRLPLPTQPAEQQKIADCLSSLDELMAAQARKVEALKTHKKGLMQQLFPREGETQPRKRFPQFEGAADWKVFPLASLADKIMVGIASAATHAYRETGVPMLRNQNIKEGDIDDSSLLFIDPCFEALHKNKRLKAGDVITVRTGYPGLSAVVPERYENAQCFTSLITRPKNNILDSDYLCAFINSEIGKRFILGAEAGGAQKNVNAGALEGLAVYLPGLEEQRRIAECLNRLDALITAETQKLEALKTHKKGLMQQLFP